MLEEVAATFAWVIPIAIVLASVGGYFLARKSLAPVVAMSSQAGRIGAANLHERLAVQNERDELGHLAQSFNSLLDRLSQSFERQQRFMADASHELRTPVAILRGEAEVALSQQTRSPEEYRESLGVLHQEAERLTHIVEDLFTLTRADAGQYPLQTRDFYLDELVAECLHSARTLALAKKISLNLIAASESPIHARFFRADKARSRAENDGGGAGLGLSISRWIAEAHHGRLELTHSDSVGSTFTAYLPAGPSPSAPSG